MANWKQISMNIIILGLDRWTLAVLWNCSPLLFPPGTKTPLYYLKQYVRSSRAVFLLIAHLAIISIICVSLLTLWCGLLCHCQPFLSPPLRFSLKIYIFRWLCAHTWTLMSVWDRGRNSEAWTAVVRRPREKSTKFLMGCGCMYLRWPLTCTGCGVWVFVLHVFVLRENACSFKIQIFKVLFYVCYRLSIFGVCEC